MESFGVRADPKLILALVTVLFERGLDFAGYTSVPLAIACWSVAAGLFMWWGFPYVWRLVANEATTIPERRKIVAGLSLSVAFAFFLVGWFSRPVPPPTDYDENLKKYYLACEELINRRVTTDEEWGSFQDDFSDWRHGTGYWIEYFMPPAAHALFESVPNPGRRIWGASSTSKGDFNVQHKRMKLALGDIYCPNLRTLIENDEWR